MTETMLEYLLSLGYARPKPEEALNTTCTENILLTQREKSPLGLLAKDGCGIIRGLDLQV